MKRKRYLMLEIPNGYIKNINTGEKYYKEMELCCITAGDDNVYLEYPIMDYPDNYVVVSENGAENPLKELLKEEGNYQKKYVLVADKTKIIGWEYFFIGECEKFYTIYIREDVLNLFEEIGFNKIKISPELFQLKLIDMIKKENLRGTEILMFADSDDLDIRKILNQKKKEILFSNIKKSCESYIRNGIFLRLENYITNLFNTEEDIKNLELSINAQSTTFINDKQTFFALNDEMKIIKEKLNFHKKVLETYKDILIDYINDKITDIISVEELNKEENFLFFGYTNDYISKKMKDKIGE